MAEEMNKIPKGFESMGFELMYSDYAHRYNTPVLAMRKSIYDKRVELIKRLDNDYMNEILKMSFLEYLDKRDKILNGDYDE